MESKVVVEQRVLRGSGDSYVLQLVATVYIGTDEYRVYAPSKATGDPLEWLAQMCVRQSDGTGELDVQGVNRNRAIEITRQVLEAHKRQSTEPAEVTKTMTESTALDKRRVFVVYGRNSKARRAVFDFLRAIDLAPMEWEEVIAATGQPSPFIGAALEKGFSIAQAAVVLLTGEDMARVGKRFLLTDDINDERVLTAQPRSNVLFEAGMAMGKFPDRTILISIGSYRKFTDIDGRHVVHLSNNEASRKALSDRLMKAGCLVKTDHKADWLKSGDFDGAIQDADLADGEKKTRLRMFKREAKDDPGATFKRKIWIEFRNESDECLLLRQPAWKASSAGIRATIRQGTFQLQLGSTWCPEKIGAAQINLPPGELCRLWAEPDESTQMEHLKQLCQSEDPLGAVVLLANGEEVSIAV